MIKLPFTDPGNPDTRSPLRFLLWIARLQWTTLLAGITFGVIWMVSQALMPAAIGQAIQQGIVDSDNQALLQWSLILLGLGATTAAAGVMRHRCAVSNWLQASFRMAQIVAHHAARTGPAIKKGHSTGEVVATVSNDAMRAGGAFDIIAQKAKEDPDTFYIMKNKVSVGLYQKFAEANAARLSHADWNKAQWKAGYPAFGVGVDDAHRFASEWLHGTLPTTRQWDKAAGLYQPFHLAPDDIHQPLGDGQTLLALQTSGKCERTWQSGLGAAARGRSLP